MSDGYEYKVEAKLFYSANANVYDAKEHLNTCRSIMDGDFQLESEYSKNVNNFVNDCFDHIKQLIEKIEDTKTRLLQHNSDFLREYSEISFSQYSHLFGGDGAEGLLIEYDEKEKNTYMKEYFLTQLAQYEELKRNGATDEDIDKAIEYFKQNVEICELNEEIEDKSYVDFEYVELISKKRDKELSVISLNFFDEDENELETRLQDIRDYYEECLFYYDTERKINDRLIAQSRCDKDSYSYHEYNKQILNLKTDIYFREIQKYDEEIQKIDSEIERLNKILSSSTLSIEKKNEILSEITGLKKNKEEMSEVRSSLNAARDELFVYSGYEQLMAEKANASGFFNTFTRSSIEKEILEYKCKNKIATPDELQYYQANALQKAGYNFGVFANAVASANYKAVEGIMDGSIMILTFPLAASGEIMEEQSIKDYMSDVSAFVKTDHAGNYYDHTVTIGGLNDYIAYGSIKTIGDLIGSTAATVATWEFSFAWELSAVGELGNSSERYLQSGDNYIQALGKSAPKAAASYVTTQALLGFNRYTRTSTFDYKKLFRNGVIASGITGTGSVINTAIDYGFSGTNMEFGEYFFTSGGAQRLGKSMFSGWLANSVSGLQCISEYNAQIDQRIAEYELFNQATEQAKFKYDAQYGVGKFEKLTNSEQFNLINQETNLALEHLRNQVSMYDSLKYNLFHKDIKDLFGDSGTRYGDLSAAEIKALKKTYGDTRLVVAKSAKSVIMSYSFAGSQQQTGLDCMKLIKIDPKFSTYVWKLVR